MSTLMKAARWHGRRDIRIEEIEVPEVDDTSVKIQVRYCGICASDVHEYREGPLLIPRAAHPLTGKHAPVVLGHELSGNVVAVGDRVIDVKVGDRVTVNALIYCGHCSYCRTGQHNMCITLGTIGFAWDGGFAEYLVVPDYSVVPLPDVVSSQAGALVEPTAVAIRAVKRSRLMAGDDVVVIGAGPIGLLVLQAARAAGAARVFVVEPIARRRALALQLGASLAWDPTVGDVGKSVAEHTEGVRAQVAFDCVGNQGTFDIAVRATSRRGRIAMIGLSLLPIAVPFLKLWGHEKEVTTSTGYVDEYAAALSLIADGRIDVSALISKEIPLEQIVTNGIEALINQPDENTKILVSPPSVIEPPG